NFHAPYIGRQHGNGAELESNRDGPRENLHHLFWPCVGCHIPVLWCGSQQKVADGSTDDVGMETSLLQLFDYVPYTSRYPLREHLSVLLSHLGYSFGDHKPFPFNYKTKSLPILLLYRERDNFKASFSQSVNPTLKLSVPHSSSGSIGTSQSRSSFLNSPFSSAVSNTSKVSWLGR